MSGLQSYLLWKLANKKASAANQGSKYDNTIDEGGNQAQGRKKDVGRFKLSFERGINSASKFLCVYNIRMHVVITVHTICEGLNISQIKVESIRTRSKCSWYKHGGKAHQFLKKNLEKHCTIHSQILTIISNEKEIYLAILKFIFSE